MDASTRSLTGPAVPRIDGSLKVRGLATYGTDVARAGQAYAYLKTSRIAKGRIRSIERATAERVPGVLRILTFREVGDRVKPGRMLGPEGYMGSTIAPLASDRIAYAGQIVAMVIAETFEAAREAAQRLEVDYDEEAPSARIDSAGSIAVPPKIPGPTVGDFAAAFAAAPVRIDAFYETPTQNHNAIELYGCTAAWEGGKLTVWESSRNVFAFKNGLAAQLGIPADDVRVVSPYVGGAFGARGAMGQHTALVAHAARVLERPVKLVATREQGFTIVHYRAETRHRIQLGASRDGKLTALRHEGWELTSRFDDVKTAGTTDTTRLYGCANIDSTVWTVQADRNTPGSMRAPADAPYVFALECAMDELAHALDMDPVELRLLNDTAIEPIQGLPFSSRNLARCFEVGAERFGWSRRTAAPRSMRDGDWLRGWGTAASIHAANVAPCAARVRLSPEGRASVECATHEVGQGVRTAIAIVAADRLGLSVDAVAVAVGDTDLPPAPLTGGSNSTSSVCSAVDAACGEILGRIARAAVADGVLRGADPAAIRLEAGMLVAADGRSEALFTAAARVAGGVIEAYVEHIPIGAAPGSTTALYKGTPAVRGGANMDGHVQFAFGAQFVEVRVHARTGEIRAPRAVGAFSFGRIVNAMAARSQLMSGQIWGLSSALLEAPEIDPETARTVNADLAEYLVPVCADVASVESIMLPVEDDKVPLGIMGVGELGIVGMNAAVANAVFHATGIRIRKLPIRIEKLLEA